GERRKMDWVYIFSGSRTARQISRNGASRVRTPAAVVGADTGAAVGGRWQRSSTCAAFPERKASSCSESVKDLLTSKPVCSRRSASTTASPTGYFFALPRYRVRATISCPVKQPLL